METTTNYGLKKPGADDLYNVEDFNGNIDTIDTNMKSISDKANSAASSLSSHTENKSNPHGVTKDQVGLGNVPNVTANDQAPTYLILSAVAEMTSCEALSVVLGKIAKFIKDGITHFSTMDTNVSNAGKNAGAWISSQIIASSASSKEISNNENMENMSQLSFLILSFQHRLITKGFIGLGSSACIENRIADV